MEISFQVTEDDYRQAFKAHRKRTAISRWTHRFLYGLFGFVLFAALLLTFFGPDKSVSNLAPLWLIAALWAVCLWYSPRRVAQKMIKGTPANSFPYTVEISEAGIHSRNPALDTNLAWNAIVDWIEVERVFAMFISPVSFFPVPKRAMTEDQQNEFRTLLRSKVRS